MHDASGRVLHFLETVEVPLHNAVQEAVAIIDPSTDNGSCHRDFAFASSLQNCPFIGM